MDDVSTLSDASFLSVRYGGKLLRYTSWCVFAILDIIDYLLCPLFALLDSFLDSEPTFCCCRSDVQRGHLESTSSKALKGTCIGDRSPLESWSRPSDTLYGSLRKAGTSLERTLRSDQTKKSADFNDESEENLGEAKTLVPVVEGQQLLNCADGVPTAYSHLRSLTKQSVESLRAKAYKQTRWSDCSCQRCISWQSDEDQLLHVYVDDGDFVASVENGIIDSIADKNVIFLHGFLSSSSFWAETVLPALPKSLRSSHRLFALDIMGFGKSPKPSNSLYTIADHVDIIGRSLFEPHGIRSFHLVAHSMGCIIALAVAAHYSSAVKSITLIAPPYFPPKPGCSSGTSIMQQVAERKIWPLITFGSAVMSWYEHIGRVVCFVICKHHRFWQPFLFVAFKLFWKRVPLSRVTDITRHTHHAAWHIFHNTICNGGYAIDHCLKVLLEAGRRVRIIHGTRDTVSPFHGSVNLSQRYLNVHLTAAVSLNHVTVVLGREDKLANELAEEILYDDGLQS